MSSFAAHISAIQTLLEQIRQADVTLLATPLYFPNTEKELPEGTLSATSRWSRFSYQFAPPSTIELGTLYTTRRSLTCFIQFFTPQGEGDGVALTLADKYLTGLRTNSTTIPGLTWYPCYPRPVGLSGKWYQVNLIMPCDIDVRLTAAI